MRKYEICWYFQWQWTNGVSDFEAHINATQVVVDRGQGLFEKDRARLSDGGCLCRRPIIGLACDKLTQRFELDTKGLLTLS